MKPFRTLSVAALVVACLWPHVGAQDPTRSLPTVPAPVKTIPASVVAPTAPAPSKTIPANVVAPQASTGPPFAVVKDKQCEVPGDLCIADYLGIEAVAITGPDSIKKVAPNGQAFKWVLTPWPKLQLYAIPKFDLTASPVNGSSDRDIIKIDVVKHIIATRGLPVQSAGHAQLQGDKLVIDNGSGHYQPTRTSVEVWAAPAFKGAGFGNVEVHDHREQVIKGE